MIFESLLTSNSKPSGFYYGVSLPDSTSSILLNFGMSSSLKWESFKDYALISLYFYASSYSFSCISFYFIASSCSSISFYFRASSCF